MTGFPLRYVLLLTSGLIVAPFIVGKCAAATSVFPILLYLAVYLYAGTQVSRNALPNAPRVGWARLRAETYNQTGQIWLKRAKLMFIAFLPVGLAFGLIGKAVCPDFPK
jgi:hypothetical protein